MPADGITLPLKRETSARPAAAARRLGYINHWRKGHDRYHIKSRADERGKMAGSRNRRPLLPLLIRRDHGDAGMPRAHDLAPLLGVEPVGALRQPLVQSVPELNAGGNRSRRLDRAQARDMLVAELAVLPAGLHQAHCQPVGRLAKVHEHRSGTMRGFPQGIAFLPGGARPLVAALASSWRTARHSITSSARASSVGGLSRPGALAVVRVVAGSDLARL